MSTLTIHQQSATEKNNPFWAFFLKSCNVCFPFSLSRIDYLSQCSLESLPVCLSPEEGQFQPVCPKVLVKCKSSNIQHENVGEWFEFLRQIPFANIAIELNQVIQTQAKILS